MSSWRRWLPSPERLRQSRWLRWLGPAVFEPRLWHLHRRGVALGVGLGVFFGLLVPIAQIPLSVAAAVALRANVPVAAASTLVSNPLTFGPLYYVAWRIGSAILDDGPMPDVDALAQSEAIAAAEAVDESWWDKTQRRLRSVGKPLLLGMAIMASASGVLAYALISGLWRLRVVWQRRRRRRA